MHGALVSFFLSFFLSFLFFFFFKFSSFSFYSSMLNVDGKLNWEVALALSHCRTVAWSFSEGQFSHKYSRGSSSRCCALYQSCTLRLVAAKWCIMYTTPPLPPPPHVPSTSFASVAVEPACSTNANARVVEVRDTERCRMRMTIGRAGNAVLGRALVLPKHFHHRHHQIHHKYRKRHQPPAHSPPSPPSSATSQSPPRPHVAVGRQIKDEQ
jgi:hypothetical protein